MAMEDTTPATPGRRIDPNAATSALGATPPTASEESSPNLPPERYSLLGQLGAGGMGVVYRVREVASGREVALKKLHAIGFSEPERLKRFERECRAAAGLDHPHIVRVLDVGFLPDGCPFYTMDLLQGQDLAAAVQGGTLSVRQAVEAIRQVAEAVHYAHQQGILHRDIKPQNVFLKRWPPQRPTAKILQRFADAAVKHVHALLVDFGLAKFIERDLVSDSTALARMTALQTMTQSGQLVGTPSFMAPEQAEGTRDLDGRVDIYGLGATLYHAVTGQPPFVASSLLELIDALGRKDPISPRAINPEVNRDLETLILRCLQKKPEDRYANAEDLAEDCQRWLTGDSITARPVGLAGRVWRRIRRAPLATAVVVALLGLAGLEPPRASRAVGDSEASARRDRAALGSALQDVFEALLVHRKSGDGTGSMTTAGRIEDLARQLVATDERMADPWYYRGRLARMAGRLDEAESSLGRALELARDPETPLSSRQLLLPALYERGVLRAERCLEALASGGAKGPAFPIDATAHPEAARLGRLAAEDLTAKAWTEGEKDETPRGQARLVACWGAAALLEGKSQGASYLQVALSKDPSLEDPYALLGRLAEIEGKWEEAASWYEKGTTAVHGASGLLRDRARALTKRAAELQGQGKDAAEVRRAAEAALKEAEALERPLGE